MTSQRKRNFDEISSVAIEQSSEIKDGSTKRICCIDKSDGISTTEDEEKQLDNDIRTIEQLSSVDTPFLFKFKDDISTLIGCNDTSESRSTTGVVEKQQDTNIVYYEQTPSVAIPLLSEIKDGTQTQIGYIDNSENNTTTGDEENQTDIDLMIFEQMSTVDIPLLSEIKDRTPPQIGYIDNSENNTTTGDEENQIDIDLMTFEQMSSVDIPVSSKIEDGSSALICCIDESENNSTTGDNLMTFEQNSPVDITFPSKFKDDSSTLISCFNTSESISTSEDDETQLENGPTTCEQTTPLDYVDIPSSSKIPDGYTKRKVCIDKSESNLIIGDNVKHTNTDCLPAFPRSPFFDPAILQRPPSFLSVKEINRQQTIAIELDITKTTVDTIMESDNERLMHSNSNDGVGPDYNSNTEITKLEACETNVPKNNQEFSVRDVSGISGCVECFKSIPVFSSDEIDEGDHIVFPGTIYDHHAIVVAKMADENFEIVEPTNTISGVATGMFFGRKARIGSSVKSFNFAKQNLRVIDYRIRQYSKKDTAERAKDFCLGERNSATYKYNLFDNNCEHFATFCVTGKKFSIQVSKFRIMFRLFLKSGFIGISDEMKRTEKEYEYGIICKSCFDINKILLDVKLRPIMTSDDEQKGDIIRYSYWNLWHEAVVLKIKYINKCYMTCYIAHYACRGIFSHRTITEEQLQIDLNGKCAMLEYGPPKYNIYDPDTVVERAKKRLGERHFEFLSNDSSHFVRWCKLKLEKE